MDNIKFGNFIKELRKSHGLTQKDLAEKINLTDKAISKWERGLSFPDITMLNSLSEVFGVSVSEIVNGEYGEEKIDIDLKVKEAIENINKANEERKDKIDAIKKIIRNISLIVLIIFSLLQLGYIFILKERGYEYINDIIFYIINETIIISGTLISVLFLNKNKIKNICMYTICGIATIINIIFMINNGFENRCIVDYSSNFSNVVILKQDRETGETILYRNRFILFAKPKEKLSYVVDGKIKCKWLANDICSLSYIDNEKTLREFVATYGDRGDGISYYYVTKALRGNWQVFSKYGEDTQLLADSRGISITNNGTREFFEYSDCKQYGTIALVLYKNEVPRYVIGLDENCEIDDDTGYIKKDGTITLMKISVEKAIVNSLYCTTYKDKDDMSNYNIVSIGKNDYKIKNGILYISYNNRDVIEVPGDFSNCKINENAYQISREKTVFFYDKNGKRYLVYSDDAGKNWETSEIKSGSKIQSIQFIDSKLGFIFEIEDTAGGDAFGKISKTIDGGKNWVVISKGIGNEGEQSFKTSSEIFFVTEYIGFITMPNISGDNSELYITKDGGFSFNQIKMEVNEVYDYYNIPKIEGKNLILEIGQGTDGDYNGGDFKEYYSTDNGLSWKLK